MANTPSFTLSELAQAVGGELRGPKDLVIRQAVPAGEGGLESITFATNEDYVRRALASDVTALIVPTQAPALDRPVVAVDQPRMAFGWVLNKLDRPLSIAPGVHPTAVVAESAQISPDAKIGPYVVVGEGASVAAGVHVHAGCFIGDDCHVGPESVLFPHVTLVHSVTVGARCRIHSGSVLGADGFGYSMVGGRQFKIPQIGRVVLEDDVEIGANTCVDRATCGVTHIAAGVKLDNLVQVGHNARVGAHTVIAGHCSLAGSSTVGERVIMGGQTGIADHAEVGSDIALGGRSGVMKQLMEPGQYMGLPAVPARQHMRMLALMQKLPEIVARITKLEKAQGDGEKA